MGQENLSNKVHPDYPIYMGVDPQKGVQNERFGSTPFSMFGLSGTLSSSFKYSQNPTYPVYMSTTTDAGALDIVL